MPRYQVPGPPASVLAAISATGTTPAPSNPAFTGRATFCAQPDTAPVPASLMTEIVQMPQSAFLDADVTIGGNLSVDGLLNATSNVTIGLGPSGDMSGAQDWLNVQTALNLADTNVQLTPGTYYINQPLVIPPYTSLAGALNSTQVSQASGGSVIQPVAGFTGITITDGSPVTLKAAIVLVGQTFGGYATTSEEQKLYHLQIKGTSAPAGVSGVLSYGRVSRVRMENVLISQMTGDGVQHNLDVAGNQPDAWYGKEVFVRYCGGKGYSLHSADSTWYMCLSSNNGDTGVDWFINTTSNSKYIGCRSEHAAGVGYGYVCTNSSNSSGGVLFQGCSTDESALHGFQAGGTISAVASFAHATPILLNGCVFRRDGQNSGSGGNYAGIYVNGYGATSGGLVGIAGCQTWPGVNDDGSGALAPKYGIWVQGGSNVTISGTGAFAATGGTAIFDDSSLGANVINYDNSTVIGAGTTSSMTVNMTPNAAQYQGAGMTLTPAAAPATDPLRILNANSGERSFGIRVVGQNNDKVKITSDAKISLGPGSATQDVALARSTTGTVQMTDAGAGNSIQLQLAASASQAGSTSLLLTSGHASTDNAVSTQVSGDTNARALLRADGLIKWGTGSATQDTALQRGAAGQLQISTDQAAGTFKSLDPYSGGMAFFGPSGQLGMTNQSRMTYSNATDAPTTSGTIYLVAYYYPAGTPVTNISYFTGTGTLKTGGQHGWYILVDSGLVVRAASADQTYASTVWGTASTPYTLAVLTSTSSVYVTTYSGLWYHGIMVANSGGTQPNLVSGVHTAAGVAGITPKISFPCTGVTGTSQTTPPTADGSVTLTGGSADGTKNFLTWGT